MRACLSASVNSPARLARTVVLPLTSVSVLFIAVRLIAQQRHRTMRPEGICRRPRDSAIIERSDIV